MRSAVASKISKIVQEARDVHGKPVVFLGGSCDDNSWRKEIDKEFGDRFFFIDPYDEDWDPKDNIYDELAGIVNSDYIVFYKGGKQTEREKLFLDSIGKKKNVIKEFGDLDSLKKYLDGLKKRSTVKKSSIGCVLRRCAQDLNRSASPEIPVKGEPVDLMLEYMDKGSINRMITDFEQGKSILVPEIVTPKGTIGPVRFDRGNMGVPEREVIPLLEKWRRKPTGPHEFIGYDPANRSFMVKLAKMGVTYKSCSTQVDLPEDLSMSIMAWSLVNIPNSILYTKDADKGREDEIHVTLFYGIQEDSPDTVQELLKSVKPFTCRLGIVTAFKDKKEYDVLKIDVESPEMVKLHYLIEKITKNKNDYPTYFPHLTIAYVKKGEADRYIGEDRFKGVEFRVDRIVFSTKDHIKIEIPLGI